MSAILTGLAIIGVIGFLLFLITGITYAFIDRAGHEKKDDDEPNLFV